MSQSFNPLDTSSLNNVNDEQQLAWDKANELIHQVFKQNPKGKKLLKLWEQSLILVPTVTPNSTQFLAGIAEGKKSVIREIILAINLVEAR